MRIPSELASAGVSGACRNSFHPRNIRSIEYPSRIAAYPNVTDLCLYLDGNLATLASAGVDRGSQHILIGQLIEGNLDLARAVLALKSNGAAKEIAAYSGTALGALLNQRSEDSKQKLDQALASQDSDAVALVAEAYLRLRPVSGTYTASDIANIRTIFASKDPGVLWIATGLLRTVSSCDMPLAVELLCSVDFEAAGHHTRDFLATFCHNNFVNSPHVTRDRLKQLVHALERVEALDDYWIGVFMKQMVARVPDEVVNFVMRRLEEADRLGNWRYAVISDRHEKEQAFGLLEVPNGLVYLRALLDWALARLPDHNIGHDFGQAVGALCGMPTKECAAELLAWMSGGSEQHARVVAAVLREVSNQFVLDHDDSVAELLNAAENISSASHELMTGALYAATISGGRSGTPGEPFQEDLDMKALATDKLKALRRRRTTATFSPTRAPPASNCWCMRFRRLVRRPSAKHGALHVAGDDRQQRHDAHSDAAAIRCARGRFALGTPGAIAGHQ
jgi:hypothetical protein